MQTYSGRILIVDDSELNLDLLEEALGGAFEIRRASFGEEALTLLETFHAELVLLDILMPGIDGYETCRRIKANERTMDTKVLLVSACGGAAERIRGYEVGASDYIVKPFDPDELLAKVHVFLALKSAEDASRAKSEFLANMSHEIRTPMTAILGYSENLRDPSLSEESRLQAIDTIWRNGQHLLELINSVLDLSKIEANRLALEQRPCDPGEVIADVIDLMRARAETAGIGLSAHCDGSIPARILGDRTRIKQVLVNLVGNAIKFTPAGSVRVVARLRADAGTGPVLEVDVIDTGIGIAPQHLATLCQPFVQADSSVTRRFGGTGLGLSISKRLAIMLGGDLTIRSAPGRGSTFTLTVATGEIEGAPMRAEIPPRIRAAASPQSAATLPEIPGRILVAEDGPDNQRLLSFILRKAGATVTVVENGRLAVDQALRACASGAPFDVILMDMQMPVLDGYAATAALREAGYAGAVVAVTAHALTDDRERCIASGCDEFIAKPVDRAALIRLIHELLAVQQ